MVVDLVAGANVAVPGAAVTVGLRGPFDLSALVVGTAGQVGRDADMIFWNAPDAPGVRLDAAGLTVTPDRLRRGAARVVVVASPEQDGATFGALPAPAAVLADAAGRPFARLTAPRLRTETVLLLAEIYRREGRWRVRSVGQGYADGLAGLARDFGVDVEDRSSGPNIDTEDRSSGPTIGGAEGPAAALDRVPLADVVTATNAERARHRLGLLTVDPRLAAAARVHSEDMVRRAFFAHENPDGAQVWDRAVAAGYTYRKVAENIAAGQPTAEEVVEGWMESPGHRANILDGELTQIGVGRAVGGSYGIYWTQVFGTPR